MKLYAGGLLALAACSPAATAVQVPVAGPALVIPPIDKAHAMGGSADVAMRFINEESAVPSGCFAVSRRTGAVACVLGQYTPSSERGERRVSILINDEDSTPDLPLQVIAGPKLDPESRKTLDKMMVDGDYVVIGGSTSAIPLDSPRSFAGLSITLRTISSEREVEDEKRSVFLPRRLEKVTELRVLVRLERPAPSPQSEDDEDNDDGYDRTDHSQLLANTLSVGSCASPSLSVRVLSSAVLIERECRLDDHEIVMTAWLCNADRARCD